MKYRIKLTIAILCLVTTLFGIGGTLLIAISFEDSLEQEIQTDINSYRMVLGTLLVISDNANWSSEEDISHVIRQLTDLNGTQSAIRLYSDNEVIYENGSLTHFFRDLTDETSPVKVAYKVISPIEVQTSLLHPESAYYLQVCGTFSAGIRQIYLDIAYDLSSVYNLRIHQQEIYFRVFLIMIAVCAVFSYGMAFVLTSPLNRLSRTSRRIASGDYECRSSLNSTDEIGQLSKDFDYMTDCLVNHMEELGAAMERQNQFVGNFTHELKTPMTSIIGYADLLRSQTLPPEEAREAANYIFSEGKRMERLSLKLLDIFIAENNKHEFHPASPSGMIRYIVDHLSADYEKNAITISTELEEGFCPLEADFFSSLVRNLLENARRALPNGGVIRVYLRMTDYGCELLISDNGHGIPEDSLSHLTEAFYRVDKSRSRAQGGAGLGLALCLSIARMHRGTIRFYSKIGKGTTVVVTINTRKDHIKQKERDLL